MSILLKVQRIACHKLYILKYTYVNILLKRIS